VKIVNKKCNLKPHQTKAVHMVNNDDYICIWSAKQILT